MTHATSCDLLVRNGDCTCQPEPWKPPHPPMRQVSESQRSLLREVVDHGTRVHGLEVLELLDALEDTEAAWRRDAESLETLTAAVREYTDGPMHRSGNCGPCVLCRAL